MLEATLKKGGQGAEGLPTFLIRRADLELQFGRLLDAENDASRGLHLLLDAAPAGSFSSRIGRAYHVLARALDAQGKKEEARNAARSAAEHIKMPWVPTTRTHAPRGSWPVWRRRPAIRCLEFPADAAWAFSSAARRVLRNISASAIVILKMWLIQRMPLRPARWTVEAATLEARNRELWDRLNLKLPNNSYVLRKMAIARGH